MDRTLNLNIILAISLMAIVNMSCGNKKCLKCTDVTYLIAKQADYDSGYKPDMEESCEGQSYFENGEQKKWTHEELVKRKSDYEKVGNYECEWK